MHLRVAAVVWLGVVMLLIGCTPVKRESATPDPELEPEEPPTAEPPRSVEARRAKILDSL